MPTTRIRKPADLAPVFRRMDRFANQRLPRAFRSAMEAAVLVLERESKERAPVGVGSSPMGHLRGSIHSEVTEDMSVLRGTVGPDVLHGLPVEEGTRPHFPPASELVDWVRLKLGVPDKEAAGVAFLVARAIARRGTKAVRYMAGGLRAADPKIRRLFERAHREAAREIAR